MSGGPLKPKSLIVVGLACVLVAMPGYGKRRHSTTPTPAAAEQPAPPPTLAQQPASPPQVSFQGGQLTIFAQNSTLGDILKAVRTQTGATIELPGNASERVVGQFGPAPARDVLASLLNGSHFNYLLLGSPTDPSALDRVILMAKSGAPAESTPPPTEQASAYNQPVFARPMAPMAAPGGNTVTVEGQDAQDDASDDSTDASDDSQADDQTDQTDNGDDQAATDDQQQQQPDGQGVKTPEQLLQELQQRQQQLQQQGIQPGVPPGMRFPNPGAPGQPGDGSNPPTPPHN